MVFFYGALAAINFFAAGIAFIAASYGWLAYNLIFGLISAAFMVLSIRRPE